MIQIMRQSYQSVRRSLAVLVTVAVVASGVVLGQAGAAGAATINETEPNGTTPTANALPIGTTVNGTTFSGSSSDVDFYSFVVPSTSQLSVGFTFPSVAGTATAYYFEIFDFAEKSRYYFSLGAGDNTGARLAGTAMYLPAGTYYARIAGSDSQPSWGKTYSLTLGLAPGAFESEFNGTTATATPLPIGTTISGSTLASGGSDVDFYSFVVPSTSQLSVGFTFPSVAGTASSYYLEIFDFAEKSRYYFSLGAGDNTGARLAGTAMYLPAGTYYARIAGSDSQPSWGKTYSLTLGLTPGAFEAEFNSSTATATPLTFGATLTASALSSGTSDTDYYVVNVSKKKKIQIDIGRSAGLGSGTAYSISLINYAGTSLGSWTLTGNGKGAPTPVAVPRGTYYVQVTGYDSATSWGKSYTVKVGYPFAKAATPKITGKVKVGHKVTAKFKKWGPGKVAMSYQWLRSGKPIAGATGKSYKLTAKDRGKRITVRIVGKKANYITLQKTSSATRKVARK